MSDNNREVWNRRDHGTIIREFGNVEGFHCPTDYVRMIECANQRINVIIDYRFNEYQVDHNWPVEVSVVWSEPATCTTYVSGTPKYHSEPEFLHALYKRSGITNGKIPPKLKEIERNQMWLSDRHREYDDFASCMDVDAWSVIVPGQVIVWDMKHANGSWNGPEERCIRQLASKGIPVIKVQYCVEKEQWIKRYDKDFVRLSPGNSLAYDLISDEYVSVDLDFQDARRIMSDIVANARNGATL